MNQAKELILFMKEFLPKLASGKVKIVSWGWWGGAEKGTFNLKIEWKE